VCVCVLSTIPERVFYHAPKQVQQTRALIRTELPIHSGSAKFDTFAFHLGSVCVSPQAS
jgi:hypothetical protein